MSAELCQFLKFWRRKSHKTFYFTADEAETAVAAWLEKMPSLWRIEQFKNQNLHPDGCQKFLWLRRLVFLILLEHYQTGILIAFAPVSQCSRPEVFQGGIFLYWVIDFGWQVMERCCIAGRELTLGAGRMGIVAIQRCWQMSRLCRQLLWQIFRHHFWSSYYWGEEALFRILPKTAYCQE